jgi:hypothetical protein
LSQWDETKNKTYKDSLKKVATTKIHMLSTGAAIGVGQEEKLPQSLIM